MCVRPQRAHGAFLFDRAHRACQNIYNVFSKFSSTHPFVKRKFTVDPYPHMRRGRIFEKKLFGCFAHFTEIPEEQRFADAIIKVAMSQPADWDPLNPSIEWAHKTLENVRSFLPSQVADGAGLYLALGTAVDWWFQTDIFFMLDLGLATVDVTTSSISRKISETRHFVYYEGMHGGEWNDMCNGIANRLLTEQRGLRAAWKRYERTLPKPG